MGGFHPGRPHPKGDAICALLLALLLVPIPILLLAEPAQAEEWELGISEYHSYQTLTARLMELALLHPYLVNMTSIATTYEGRDVWAVRLGAAVLANHPGNLTPLEEPAEEPVEVLIMGGHHGREIAAIEVPMGMIEFLVAGFDTDGRVRKLLLEQDIWIVPLLNPDGLEYAKTHPNWRKNRTPIDLDNDGLPEGFGVDLNRNYDNRWCTQGGSLDPTHEKYCGLYPFSENETRGIRDLVLKRNFTLSLSYHTYGEVVYYPWGNSLADSNPNSDILSALAREYAQRAGYTYMEGHEDYLTSGDSDDWLHANTTVLPLTIEMGYNSFWPTPSQINDIFDTNLESILYTLELADDPERALLTDWTIMYYMAGDNDLGTNGVLDHDLNLLETVGSSSTMNVIALADWNGDGNSVLYKVKADTGGMNSVIASTPLDDNGAVIPPSGEVNMADPQTLWNFVNYSLMHYPAQRTMLVIWDHGSGILDGVALDHGWLTLYELPEALTDPQTGKRTHIDIIGMDLCSLAQVETAWELYGFTDQLVASQGLVPSVGWDDSEVLKRVQLNLKASPASIAKGIVDDYISGSNVDYISVSAADLNLLPLLMEPLDQLADGLRFAMFENQDAIRAIRNEILVLSPQGVDISSLAKAVLNWSEAPADLHVAASNVFANLSLAVPAAAQGSAVENASGQSIYFPTSTYIHEFYELLSYPSNSRWDEFLKVFFTPTPIPVVLDLRLDDGIYGQGPFEFTALISPAESWSPVLKYWFNSSTQVAVNMTENLNGWYQASIDSYPPGAELRYWVEVEYLPDEQESSEVRMFTVMPGQPMDLAVELVSIYDPLALSPDTLLVGEELIISFALHKLMGEEQLEVDLAIYLDEVGNPAQRITVPTQLVCGNTTAIFVLWAAEYGNHTIHLRLDDRRDINSSNNYAEISFFVDADFDADGVGNEIDPDIDGDGWENSNDIFDFDATEWADLDGDLQGDNADPDIDGDNVNNTDDAFPRDPTEWEDSDGDGVGNNADPTPFGSTDENSSANSAGLTPSLKSALLLIIVIAGILATTAITYLRFFRKKE